MCKNFTISELQVCAMLGHLYSATSLCKVLHGRLEVTKLFFKDLQDLTKCLLFGLLYSIIICASIDFLQVFSLRINQIQRPLSFEYLHARVQREKYFSVLQDLIKYILFGLTSSIVVWIKMHFSLVFSLAINQI